MSKRMPFGLKIAIINRAFRKKMCIRDRNMGAQLVKEVASKTNDVVGDGTTTATLLAQSIIHEGLRNLAAGAGPMQLRVGIEKATNAAVEAIKKVSRPVEGKQSIAHVGTVSSQDVHIGELIADAMEKVGNDGVITVEESKTCLLYTSYYTPKPYLCPALAAVFFFIRRSKSDVRFLTHIAFFSNILQPRSPFGYRFFARPFLMRTPPAAHPPINTAA